MSSTQRIVSLLPSSTEIICALGCSDRLVGRSHECDYPASVIDLPACSEAKFDPDGTSYEIDQRVKAVLQEAVSVYRVHGAVLDELEPDLLVTQSQCEVCAVSLADVEAAACELVKSQPEILSLAPNALADIWRDIGAVAKALAVEEKGAALVAALQARLDAIAERARAIERRPRIACIEWFAPLMAAGNWVPELVEIAGGENLFGAAGEHSPWMAWGALEEAQPEVIALMPCGFDMERCRRELPALADNPVWGRLEAAKTGRVYLTDGNQFFNRPGPRLVESAEILAQIMHPESFASGHEGTGWIRLEP